MTDPNKPSPTILARGNGEGGVCAIQHPRNHRRMTIRESALIQTFPLDFVFVGKTNSCYRQVGNAVPVLFARRLGDQLKKLDDKRLKVVSLFSGAGGLDLGFQQSFHKIVWANDNYKDAFETYKSNIGDHIFFKDIKEISISEIPDCDIVIGGFPCQGFSVANAKRSENDSRNKLYLELLRVIKEKQPKYFLAENVKGLASLGKGKVLEMILRDFETAGYRVKYKILDAADYGVPQHRFRIIFLGIRKDIERDIDFPKPTHCNPKTPELFKKPWISVGEALRDVPEPEDAPHIPNHTYSKYKLRFVGYLGHRRMNPKEPAPTITARGDERGGVVVLHHPNNHRRMSARELAIVQTFPMNFVFYGSRTSAYRQIANAVPPRFAKALAAAFYSQ